MQGSTYLEQIGINQGVTQMQYPYWYNISHKFEHINLITTEVTNWTSEID